MALLGSYGQARREADNLENETFDTVEVFGKEFRLANEVSGALAYDVGDAFLESGDGDVETGMRNLGVTKHVLRSIIHEDDWRGLWAHVRSQKGDLGEFVTTLETLAKDLLEHVENRPTVRPSDSSAGPTTTGDGTNSSASGTQPSEVFPVAVPVEFGARPGETPLPDGTVQLPNGSYLYPDGTGGYTASPPDTP